MKRITFLLFSIFFATQVFGQREETLFGPAGLDFSGAWGGSHNHISQFDDDYAIFSGGFFELEFGQKVNVGWAWYKLTNDVNFDNLNSRNFDMKYNGLTASYMLNAHKVFHPTFGLMAGKGKVDIEENDIKDNVFVLQPAIGLEINLLRWFHIGLEGGYRMVTDTDIVGLSDADLSAPFGTIKFKFGWSWD